MGNLHLVAELLPGSREGLEIGLEDLCSDLGIEGLDERVDVNSGEEELVKSVVGSEQDLGKF